MRLPKQIKSLQKPPNDASLTWADFTPATSGPWSVMLSKPTDTCQHHRLLSGVAGTWHSLFHLKCKEHPLGPVTAALCPQVGAGQLGGQQCSQVTPFSAPTRGVNRQPGLQAMRPASAALIPALRLPCAPAGMRELRRCGGRTLPGRSDVSM